MAAFATDIRQTRYLDRVLNLLQDPNPADRQKLLGNAAHCLYNLTNPANISLLTTQILVAPGIWHPFPSRDLLRYSQKVYGAFVAALRARAEGYHDGSVMIPTVAEWIVASIKGATAEPVPRWRAAVALGGLLSTYDDGGVERPWRLPSGAKNALEDEFVKAANDSALYPESMIAMTILSNTYGVISPRARFALNVDIKPTMVAALTPMPTRSLLSELISDVYYSHDGFCGGSFLDTLSPDVKSLPSGEFSWPPISMSFRKLEQYPNLQAVSSLARLGSVCIADHVNKVETIHDIVNTIYRFSDNLLRLWAHSAMSRLDEARADDQTRQTSLPLLWQVLKAVVFTTTGVLGPIMTRIIQSSSLGSRQNGPTLAGKLLSILRNIYFIYLRLNTSNFAAWNNVYYASIDILSFDAQATADFLRSIAPRHLLNTSPTTALTPIDQSLDLFYLNIGEHLTHRLPQSAVEELLLPPAQAYLQPPRPTSPDGLAAPLFESAHTLILSLLSSPTCPALAASFIPFYVDSVFTAFPPETLGNNHSQMGLSAQQFRLAIATVIRECQPPRPLGVLHAATVQSSEGELAPLAEVVLELLSERIGQAQEGPPVGAPSAAQEENPFVGTYGEKHVLLLSLLDSLSSLPPHSLIFWLERATLFLNSFSEANPILAAAKRGVRERLWEVLSSGELDVERGAIGAGWWTSLDGRQRVVQGPSAVGADGRL